MFVIDGDFTPPCRTVSDPDRFFSTRKADVAWAKAHCGSCRIQLICLERALEFTELSGEQLHGTFGGLTEAERANTKLTRIA